MAFAAAALPFIAAAGTVLSVVGSIREGQQAKNIANMNAALSLRQAEEARVRAASQVAAAQAEAVRARRRARGELGKSRVGFVSGGLTLEGTPTDVLADQASELELDARLTEFRGDLATFEGETQARALETEAGLQRLAGKQARQKSLFQAGSTLLTGGVKFGESFE